MHTTTFSNLWLKSHFKVDRSEIEVASECWNSNPATGKNPYLVVHNHALYFLLGANSTTAKLGQQRRSLKLNKWN